MKSKFVAGVFMPLVLAGCGTITLPAAVKMSNGEAMMGTTTAAISGGRFEVATPRGDVSCSGSYDALDTRPVITAPVRCSDGRYGTITVLRAPDGMSGTGNVVLADGTAGNIAFGRAAASVLATSEATSPIAATAPVLPVVAASQSDISTEAGTAAASSPAAFSAAPTVGSTYSGPSGRTYTGNCPTPESLDAAGHRCGARSAASRPGGYSGYGTWATPARSYGGTVNVRGYYRKNGTYVRSYSRRR
jgi:hypothetical protein